MQSENERNGCALHNGTPQSQRDARRARERAEIAEAVQLGIEVMPKLRFDRFWTEAEDEAIRQHFADLKAAVKACPGRTRNACSRRRYDLGLMPKFNAWTTKEEAIIRANYLKVQGPTALAKLLPGRSASSVTHHLEHMGITIPKPAADTGNTVVNAIKDRCRALGYNMADLDRLARTGKYFQNKHWSSGRKKSDESRGNYAYSWGLSAGVTALGGELRVEWPD